MKNVMLWAGAGQIGMAIARRMGGDVQVRSCPGQGCTFTLEVRLEIVEGGPGPKSMNEAGFDVTPVEMDLSSRSSIKALIAGDRGTARSRCSSTLRVCRPVRRPSRRS